MKKMMMMALVLMIGTSAFAKKTTTPVKVVSTNMDVVYFKVSCDMIGASMVIYDQTGKMIHTEKVTDKKVLVDFYAEPSGAYTIHVQKDGKDEVISYKKSTTSHAELASHNFISVTQM